MPETIPRLDNLFRAVRYPVAFKSKGKSIFRSDKFIKLIKDPNNPRFVESSLAWERYVPIPHYVHAYGCRLARTYNAKNAGRTPHVYCGSYTISADDIRNLSRTEGLPEVASADVLHQIEDDEISHASLQVRLADSVDKNKIDGVLTVIVDRLWANGRGPLKHVCRDNADLDPHPSDRLNTGPKGLYIDNRSPVKRIGHLLRFWFLYSIWNFKGRPA
jgi:hypothetical protein